MPVPNWEQTGTIAQMLSPVAKKVIGVEIIEEAVEAAKENAQLNGLHNCEFIAVDVLKVIDSIEEKPDYIVLDPPRDGINPKALEKIIRYNVPQMVYISCKPTSLARDLEVLQAINHMEPDHGASIEEILLRYPKCKVISTDHQMYHHLMSLHLRHRHWMKNHLLTMNHLL